MGGQPELNDEVRRVWETNAAFWDARFEEGNDFHRELVAPSAARLLALRPGEWVLEIACGNGAFARWMAAQGCHVVATDLAESFLALARERTTEHTEYIEYRWADATDEPMLLALADAAPTGRYDAIVCNMALMDMAEIGPLMRAAPRLLKPGGRLVFTIMHPCFNSPPGIRHVVEEVDVEGEMVETHAVVVSRYLRPSVAHGLGMRGQPVPQLYFHRPLSALLGDAFAAGLVMDGLEEPAFDATHREPRKLSWGNLHEIPPVMAVRLRVASDG
jgi:2-polyprenyl-3-methyl-5-hydroxy-6-metoxy-1,4-benzoquinol methylase